MKKRKFISSLLIASLLFGTLGVNATSITFDDLEQSGKTLELEKSETVDNDSIQIEMEELESVSDNSLISFDELETNISEVNTPLKATNDETSTQSDEVWNFGYTGQVEEFTAPYSGLYKLEAYGAQGGSSAVQGANGGFVMLEIPLLEGEKIYITIGGQGIENGKGGFNGGGDSTLGGSGGGATSIQTELIGDGQLKNYITKKDSVLLVAAGGGGSYHHTLPNQDAEHPKWNEDKQEYLPYYYKTDAYTLPGSGGMSGNNSQPTERNQWCYIFNNFSYPKGGQNTEEYFFGQGESGLSGAGGGLYGGEAGNLHYVSGAGGSSYAIETEWNRDNKDGVNNGDGKLSITYLKQIERTVFIKTNGCGTYNGNEEIQIIAKMGEKINIPEIDLYDGYYFLSYVDNDNNKYNSSFIMGKENIRLKALFYAPLIINTEKDGENSIRINMLQNDEIEKYYKVLQSKDGLNWYDAALSIDGENGMPTKNKIYTPGSYTYKVPITGDYKIRLFGGKGGDAYAASHNNYAYGGKGAYTEGTIRLERGTVLFINIGVQGNNDIGGGYGLGAIGGSGHASDVRVNSNSIDNRIIVASGGGGAGCYLGTSMNGSNGGALTAGGAYCENNHTTGANNKAYNPSGATQTQGGGFYYDNTYYKGQSPMYNGAGTVYANKAYPLGHGGYGYYCGAGIHMENNISGGTGGSSYISGYPGCITFPGYVFENPIMLAGQRNESGYGWIDILSDLNVYEDYINEVYFYDTKAPNSPSNGTFASYGDKIQLNWQDNGDNGDKYYHKVESYEKETDKLINTSDVLEEYLETGVKGYYYYIDANKIGTVSTSNEFTTDASLLIKRPSQTSYIHIAAVDYAGNISNTYTFEIPSVANYTIKYYKMDLNGNYVLDETVTDTAVIGTEVTPEVKEYIGFTSPQPITKTVLADGSTLIEYYYERNKYTVTYIDKTPDGKEIGRTTKLVYYDADVRGSDIGSSDADNAYYNQYRYVSDTSATVTTEGAIVYRIFEFCETEKESHLAWNDNNDADNLRPEKYTLKLKQNGIVIDEVELPTDTTDYIFDHLPKYDEDGNPYIYEIEAIVSDRYKPEYGEDGSLIFQDYQPANFSVVIPKQITLSGLTGSSDYSVSVKGTFYYNDTLTVQPNASFTLTDRNELSSIEAKVKQDKTTFTKEDNVAVTCQTEGNIKVNKPFFAGKWNGSFNFDIKFVMQN